MHVDGEPVVHVVLRLTAHALPLGQEAPQEPGLIHRLERPGRSRAGGQQPEERAPGLVGPGVLGRPGPRLPAQPRERLRRHRRTECGGLGERAHRERWIGRRRDAFGDPDQAVRERDPPGELSMRTLAAAPFEPARQLSERRGRRELDHARARVQVPQEGIDARPAVPPVPERLGDLLLIGEQQHVGRTVGEVVELVPRPEQHLAGTLEVGPLDGREVTARLEDLREPSHDRTVPQPSGSVLQVRLEQVRRVSLPRVTHRRLLAYGIEELRPPLAGLAQRGGREFLEQLGVAGEQPRVEERRLGLEVDRSELEGVLHGADGVADLEAGVPQLVEEPLAHLRRDPASGVEHHQIDVGVRTELAAPVAAERDESDPVLYSHRLSPDGSDRRVHRGGQSVDEIPAGASRVFLQALPFGRELTDRRGGIGARGHPSPPRRCVYGRPARRPPR